MIYLETNSTNACYNFAAEYLFAAEQDVGDELFLFWQTEPTLMIGRYQNALEEIDLPYAQKRGIRVVRRLSGGGTIYTDLGGWQYSFIAPGEGEIDFRRFLAPVLRALRELGVPAEFNGRNDLTVAGRKFSGTAQYRLGGKVVHHGSLLFDTDLAEMERATTVRQEKIASKGIRSVRDRVTNLREHLPSSVICAEFKERMVSAILGMGERRTLNAEQIRRVSQSARRNSRIGRRFTANLPDFSITRSRRFVGGRVEFLLDVEKGVIRAAELRGDFFGAEAAQQIPQRLIGVRYERNAVLQALEGFEGAIYQVRPEEIAQVVVD